LAEPFSPRRLAVAPTPPPPAGAAEATERRLLQAIAAGDQAALGTLFDGHAPALLGLLHRMLGEDGEAEEVLQEVFLWVWRHGKRFDAARGSLRGWLLMLARSRALDRLRASRSLRAREREFACQRPTVVGPLGTTTMEERERRQLVRTALATLPREQRLAIERAFFDGLTHVEIATLTGTPLGTVKSRIALGVARLRRALRSLAEAEHPVAEGQPRRGSASATLVAS
jgi:RNA polymerase sigma-70 factor (ECF subfamily)